MTFHVVCETDASAERAMATRRGVGRVRHLDARLLWLQQLCAEGVVEVRARPGTHNEADMGTKMVDLKRMTTLLKGTPLRPPMGWSSWLVATSLPADAEAAKDCRVLIWNARKMCETSIWFWICVGMVIALLAVLSGGPIVKPISDDWKSAEGDRGGCMAASKVKLSSTDPGSGESHIADDVIADTRSARIDWTAARYILSVEKARPSIVRRQSGS